MKYPTEHFKVVCIYLWHFHQTTLPPNGRCHSEQLDIGFGASLVTSLLSASYTCILSVIRVKKLKVMTDSIFVSYDQ